MLSNLGAQRHLFHIRDNIILARDFIQSLTYEAFRGDVLVFYAVTRCLEIISEESRRIPVEMKARHPEIPWADIADAGNVYRHNYEDVQHRLVWGVVNNRFPALQAFVEAELLRIEGDQ